jgi:hypothetical protein
MGKRRISVLELIKSGFENLFDGLMSHKTNIKVPSGFMHSPGSLKIILGKLYPISGFLVHPQ